MNYREGFTRYIRSPLRIQKIKNAKRYKINAILEVILCGITRNVDILWLVSTHMSPFLNEKYYRNLPPFLKSMVDQLHEADLAAH